MNKQTRLQEIHKQLSPYFPTHLDARSEYLTIFYSALSSMVLHNHEYKEMYLKESTIEGSYQKVIWVIDEKELARQQAKCNIIKKF